MPNHYFSFKKFTIQQDQCAMKVCTDACLFGAWVAERTAGNHAIQHILDIGTGTGLLTLMLAQKNNAAIDAVELNEAAASQAAENFEASPWKERLQVFQTGIENFGAGKKYDLIISNPPFFEDDLKSAKEDRNTAMHSTTLSLETLLKEIKRSMKEDGRAAVLIPYHRSHYFEQLLEQHGFFVNELMQVKQSVKHDHFRSQYIFSLKKTMRNTSSISIHDEGREYTKEFVELLKHYYLKL